jgi:hypothetical protein
VKPPRFDYARWRGTVPPAVLIGLGLLIFWSFVFGNKTLLYKDIGSDSVDLYYPFYVLLSDYVRQVGIFSWSFRLGMGQDLFPYMGTALLAPVVWLPKAAIAQALVYQHLLYVLSAGLLFWRFLRLRGLGVNGSLLGAMLLSFSGYMCMGSSWYLHAQEVVAFAFLLFAAEHGIGRGRWHCLALAMAVIAVLGPFHL